MAAKREEWLDRSRKAIDALRELQGIDIGNPQFSEEMRKDMEEFMRRVEQESP